MIESIAVGTFVFVALAVGGLRLLAAWESAKAKVAAEKAEAARRRGSATVYHGPVVNRWGREL